MPSLPHSAVRDLLLARAAAAWRDARPAGRLGRLLAWLVRYRPPDALWVAEYGWDGGADRLTGRPAGTWVIDDRGLAPGDFPEPPWDVRGMYFAAFRVRFGIAPDGQRVLWQESRGPRAGSGVVLTVAGGGATLGVTASESLWRA